MLAAGRWLRALALLAALPLYAQNGPQRVPENATTRVSDHVYVIIGFPNIEYVVGSRGTLVVDTGMGVPNGTVVVREAEKLSKGPNLYLTTTHFHPEHASGEQAFPAKTVIIRPAVQQQEMEKHGEEFFEMFRGFSAQFKNELKDVKIRRPDLVFDREVTLDLGGVTARLFWLGAAHTQGDELIMVEPDSALISGDIVQNKIVPNMPNADANVKNWLAILDQLEPLKPRYVVPDHGALGDGSLIGKERAFLSDLQTRALALKRQGKSADEAAQMIADEFKTKYPDWQSMGPVANVVRRVYAEAP
ncbi:MAG TPA: MBL fold metallo-hydrolase [Bryobacteraceae bacterium]|nr:MBL fold metallo-hydrolase [Bryobacteraceae bacterium]